MRAYDTCTKQKHYFAKKNVGELIRRMLSYTSIKWPKKIFADRKKEGLLSSSVSVHGRICCVTFGAPEIVRRPRLKTKRAQVAELASAMYLKTGAELIRYRYRQEKVGKSSDREGTRIVESALEDEMWP